MRGRRTIGVVLVALSVIFTACAGGESGEGSASAAAQGSGTVAPGESAAESVAPESPAAEPLTVGLVINQGNFFFQNIQDTLRELVEADGGQVIVVNTNNDAAVEAQAVADFVQRQVDVILLAVQAADSSVASVEAANEAGIPVVCYNNCLSEEDTAELTEAYILSDNTDLGAATGKLARAYIEEELDGSARIALLTCDAFEVCVQRREGFQAELEGLDIEYVANQEAYLADVAATVGGDIITANPEVDAFWAVNEGGTVGGRAAIAASGKEIVLFGTDISPEIAQLMLDEEDIVQMVTGQDGEAIARAAFEAAKTAAAGETVDPHTILVPGKTYSRDDPEALEEYLEAAE